MPSLAIAILKWIITPKNLVITVLGGVILFVGFTLWNQGRIINNLERENTSLTLNLATQEILTENKEAIIGEMEARTAAIEKANQELADLRQKDHKEINRLRDSLNSIDFEAMAKSQPEQLQDLFDNFFQQQLACIEHFSGNTNEDCNRP